MTTVNVNNRASIEALYPRDVWESDAGTNSQTRKGKLRGLLIVSPPSADGNFHLRRALRSVADCQSDPHVAFVCPYMGRAYDIFTPAAGVHGAVLEKRDALEDHSDEYQAFIDGIISAARQVQFPPIPGSKGRLPKG